MEMFFQSWLFHLEHHHVYDEIKVICFLTNFRLHLSGSFRNAIKVHLKMTGFI
jgi:hypothetical protein